MKTDAFDHYMTVCVQAFLRSRQMPAWPTGLEVGIEAAAKRITFHGIALLLVETAPDLPGWPIPLADAVKQEARVQTFWEMSHADVIAQLLGALRDGGQYAVLLKGTALAYSDYPLPAIRRRGDSDLLIENGDRAKVRRILGGCGFFPCGDARPLQEAWRSSSPDGFNHVVDLHWRISASSAVSGLLEANLPRRRKQELPRLSEHAQSLGPVDNLILISLNRAQHGKFGYLIGTDRLFENDRLIWAVDLDLLTTRLGPDEWNELFESASASGSSDIVLSGLRFAERVTETSIPENVLKQLERQRDDAPLSAYLSNKSGKQRFVLDLAASPTLSDKLRLIAFKLFPSQSVVRERYPDDTGWPIAALHVRRLLSGLRALMVGKA